MKRVSALGLSGFRGRGCRTKNVLKTRYLWGALDFRWFVRIAAIDGKREFESTVFVHACTRSQDHKSSQH
jgi:hypothetical protein